MIRVVVASTDRGSGSRRLWCRRERRRGRERNDMLAPRVRYSGLSQFLNKLQSSFDMSW